MKRIAIIRTERKVAAVLAKRLKKQFPMMENLDASALGVITWNTDLPDSVRESQRCDAMNFVAGYLACHEDMAMDALNQTCIEG